MFTENVTGICIPCAGLLDCGQTAKAIACDSHTIKIGREFGCWYVIVIFNKG